MKYDPYQIFRCATCNAKYMGVLSSCPACGAKICAKPHHTVARILVEERVGELQRAGRMSFSALEFERLAPENEALAALREMVAEGMLEERADIFSDKRGRLWAGSVFSITGKKERLEPNAFDQLTRVTVQRNELRRHMHEFKTALTHLREECEQLRSERAAERQAHKAEILRLRRALQAVAGESVLPDRGPCPPALKAVRKLAREALK